MPTQVQQPPPELHHDPHSKHANAMHRDALLQALGSILAPKRPTLAGRSSSASTVDSSRSSSGTASPAHGHPAFPFAHLHPGAPAPHPSPLHHPHAPSPLAHADAESEGAHAADSDPPAADPAPVPAPAPLAPAAVRPKIIDSLKSKNGAWDALIHGSFS